MALKRSSNRPKETWYIPKPVNDVDRIIDAVVAIQEMDGKKWYKGTSRQAGTQTELQQLIKDAGDYGGTPSDMAGRNWMGALQFFGFAYIKKPDKIVTLTDVGKLLVKNRDRRCIVIRQLLKLQFPNPYQIKSMSEEIRVAPFWAVLKAINDLDYLTQSELASYLLWLRNMALLPDMIKMIKYARMKKLKPKILPRIWEIVYDYASRFRLCFTYTNLILDDGTHEHKMTLNRKKIPYIKKILSAKPQVDAKYSDKSTWNKWFSYYGSTPRPYRNITGKLTGSQYRARLLHDFFQQKSEYSKTTQIQITEIEKHVNLSYSQIRKIMNTRSLYVEFPLLEKASLSGNHIIISSTKSSNRRSEYSKKVEGFSEIIDDSMHSDDYVKFEEDVESVFNALQFQVEPLGTKKAGSAVPDLIIKSGIGKESTKYWACLVDAKSRQHGFDIGTNSRRAMKEYAENYEKKMSLRNPIPLKSVLFVSSYFTGDVDNKLGLLKKETKYDCSCISAKNLLYLLDIHMNNPGSITHEKILDMFTSNEEIERQMIDENL